MQASKNKLAELQRIISKIPMHVNCMTVLPIFGVHWREMSRAVRNARLPMVPSSISRVLCRQASRSLTEDEVDDILGKLRLTLVATQSRKWHVILLMEPTTEEPVTVLLRTLPQRVTHSLRQGKQINMSPEVQSIMLGDLMYLSIKFVSATRETTPLYVAIPPGEPVALVSSVTAHKLIKACVEAIGYAKYENADLHGHDIPSLLCIANQAWNGNADELVETPAYAPTPVILPNGIDYTNKTYDQNYVDSIIGPNPPLLTELKMNTTKMFYDNTLLNKPINMKTVLKSEDVAKTLKAWVANGAIAPTSNFFQIYQKLKSNNIQYNNDSD